MKEIILNLEQYDTFCPQFAPDPTQLRTVGASLLTLLSI